MTNAAISLAFSCCGGSNRTHFTDARIFASRSIRCAIASMTLRIGGVNVNGLDAFTYCRLLWKLGRKETPKLGKALWWLRSIAWIDLRQGVFPRINVMEGGLDKGPSGFFISWFNYWIYASEKHWCREWDQSSLETCTQGILLLAFFIGVMQWSSNDWSVFDFTRDCISSSVLCIPLLRSSYSIAFTR